MGIRSIFSAGPTSRQSRNPRRRFVGAVESLERRSLLSATLPAIADADVQDLTLDGSIALLNFGADPSLRVRTSGDETFESYLTFDVSKLKNVTNATLKLHGGQSDAQAAPVVVGAFAATTTFEEGTGTHASPLGIVSGLLGAIHWSNRPAISGEALSTASVGAVANYTFDVTGLVQSARKAGLNTVTVALKQAGGAAAQVAFDAKEIAAPGVAPVLDVVENLTGPVATFSAPDITTAGGATQSIVVTYADTDAINLDTVDAGDIAVTGPSNAPLEITGLSINSADPKKVIATYTVAAPGGTWDVADAGNYTTTVKAGAVLDTAGNAVTGGPDVFAVVLTETPPSPPADSTPPQGTTIQNPESITESGTGTTIGVRFTDNVSVDTSAISTESLVVKRREGTGTPLQILDVGVEPSADGKSSDVLFSVVAPNGSWSIGDNGLYDFSIAAGAATDAAGNASNSISGSFTIALPLPGSPPTPTDTAAPTASLVPLDALTTAGASTREVRVIYADDTAVRVSSIGTSDLVVAGPNGSTLNVTGFTLSAASTGQTITATYTVAAPGGVWDDADNGVYTISVPAGAVLDTSDNSIAAFSGNFSVAIPAPKPAIDENFGGGVAVNTGFVGEASVGQSDGKIIVVGRQGDLTAGTSRLVLQRLNSDGSFDTSFGTSGKVIGAEGLNEAAYAVVVDADGNLLVAGRRGSDLIVSRYKSNGSLDTRFGTGGTAVADFGGEDVAYSLAIAPDGAILAAGGSDQAGTTAFAFAKFSKDGKADLSFGTSGRALFSQGAGGNVAGSVAIDAAGRVVAAGPTENGKVAVVRLNANGTEDGSFAAGGILVIDGLATRTDLGRPDRSIGVVTLANNSILVANHSAGGDFAVAKISADGSLDATFGTAGVATIDFGGDDDADAILVQGSGELLVIGTTTADGNKLAVAALDTAGQLIPSFGAGGKLTIDATPVQSSRELHLGDLVLRAFGTVTGDGRLVIGASDQSTAAVSSSPLRRLNVPGSGLLGEFGQTGGKKARKLTFQDADGTVVTLSMKGAGRGQAFYDGAALDLVLTGISNSSLVMATKGGDGRVSVRNVRSDGAIKSITGKTMDLAGTFAITAGGLGKASVGTLTGTLAVAGSIASLTFAGDVKGKVLSGAGYGSDGASGGSGTAADSFAEGRIGKVSVAGSVVGAVFAAGVNPINAQLLDGDDILVGGAANFIGPVTVKGSADLSSRFVAGAFAKKVKLPQTTATLSDARFVVL